MKTARASDTGGLVTAVAMLAVSGWVFWEAEGYTELAAVFPRTIALVLALASVVLIVRCLLGRQRGVADDGGSHLRRGAVVAVLAGWLALIPVLGFATASLAGFVAMGATAHYERWSIRRWAGFMGLALAAVAMLYGLFSTVLRVPFPKGMLL